MSITPDSSGDVVRPPSGGEDYRLMERVRSGDASAMAMLYDRHGPALFALCLRMLRNQADAEDLLIEIFCELLERADRYDPGRGSPLLYMMGVARSRATDRLRARAARARIGKTQGDGVLGEVSGAEPDPLLSAETGELRRRVARAMRELTAEQRQALELAYFDSMSYAQVAEELSEPVGTVKSRIRQALMRLRTMLGGDTP